MSERTPARRARLGTLLLACAISLAGCKARRDWVSAPSGEEVPDPRQVLDFAKLYGTNCAGCHGESGRRGAAIGLTSAAYLAFATDTDLRQVIDYGRPHTAMPAFAQSAGGMLNDLQVEALVHGIRAWAEKGRAEATQPSDRAAEASDAIRGARVFADSCGSCHGVDGRGTKGVGSIVDQDFLELVSEQGLRSSIVAGRPELGCPGSHGVAGRTLSSQDVSDAVTWLASHRRQSLLEPYRSARADKRNP